ncbi:SDR family oxidoreductase [Pontibacter korlensis]|uniref:Sugar epimerase n=1 Tax=Pontibacter korlensis TaxID=400092 RepID=A0A0E3UVZ5_9BACT|nr:SDR family oxidoreductase [Pontibacter korlensis]AKD02942.1 sugar epimerase [Pontibacter korlensis]
MKVLLIGANGQVGQHIVDMLQDNDLHSLRAMVRKEEQAQELQKRGIEAVLANLEGSVDELAKAMEGCDAVVFSAGSGGSTGYDKTLLIDLDGAAKAVEAAEKAGIKRFIMVSAIQAHRRENWSEELKPYFVAKHYADKVLEASSLNYTIVRPGGLLNEPATGKVKVAEDLERGSIPREDVAAVIIRSLTEEKAFRRSFDLVSGETPVAEALQLL